METDVLVIGGGATGGGIAWDLALRGVRVVLAEMGDLATGTSGRYHGLLHSGGRYAVRDPESAKECIDENMIVRRIAPEAIEDTGGYFVLCPGDPESYIEEFVAGCKNAGIPTWEVPLAEARKREKILNPKLRSVYYVPDGTCDSWDLLHLLQNGAQQTGKAQFLTYHKVTGFHKGASGEITGATLTNLRTGESFDLACRVVINAAGPWAAEIGALAGASFKMKLSRGAMLAYNIRWVNTVINKMRKPGDGDIFVPVGTVSVIGTTSVKTEDPGDIRVEPWEVKRILEEAEAMTPGISRARILRAWGGVRPLYDPGESADGRGAKRTFAVLDHGPSDGVEGLLSILGGKLTTFRMMAERVADMACAKLGVTTKSSTASTVLPSHHTPRLHLLRDRLNRLEHGDTPGALVCECELVTTPQIEEALSNTTPGKSDVFTLNDLRRDLRMGMGPCQGGFCAYRAAGVRHACVHDTADHSRALLGDFVERRVGGMKALLWGHNLRQVLLAEQIYGRMVGLSTQPGGHARVTFNEGDFARAADDANGAGKRVVVIGGGLSGLMAGIAAQKAGARVEIVAHGQGTLSLHPGWLELGDVAALAARPTHPYHHSHQALPAALDLLNDILPIHGGEFQATQLMGTARPVDYAVGGTLRSISPGDHVLVAGISGWRDFYPGLIADALGGRGVQADAISITLPHMGGNFDDWPLDYAGYLDTDAGLNQFVSLLKPHIRNHSIVLLPAVLGFADATRQRLTDALGVPLVEIPTLPPSVPGTRLFRKLRDAFLAGGGRYTVGPKALGLVQPNGRVTGVQTESASHGRPRVIPADAVILATGGLYGGGYESDYTGRVWEPVAHAPVHDVPELGTWFAEAVLTGQPQPIHAAHLATDAQLRPLGENGRPCADNLFAAGRVLGGTSPVSEGCAEGIDLATGVHAALSALGG
ncbi:MAG: anaerobic glycerol-3-phosphate dehydrogenase subunit A [Pleurocapsa minor GSE-CHR-MK-17-07R]|jgi:glycerol-3-phosphate dehydrogenase|nr:anaerobic glycerol-3-phosphate dehydrogenase subunit A [Pleurocapsa minor GSE-CHR-MK 17-07R]